MRVALHNRSVWLAPAGRACARLVGVVVITGVLAFVGRGERLAAEAAAPQAVPVEDVLIDFESFAPGTVLTDQIPGILFPNGAVVVSSPPAGFMIPEPLTGSGSRGICAVAAGGGDADCRSPLYIQFPDGVQSVRFNVVGGYSDNWCNTRGTVNNDEYFAQIIWGPPTANGPPVRLSSATGNLYYQWSSGVTFENFENIVRLELFGSERTSICGRGVSESAGYAGGIALDDLRITRSQLCPVAPIKTLDQLCRTSACTSPARAAFADLESGDSTRTAQYLYPGWIDSLLSTLAQSFVDSRPGGVTLPRNSGYRPIVYQDHFRDLHDISQDLANLLDQLPAGAVMRAQCQVRLDQVNREIDQKHGIQRDSRAPFSPALRIGAQLPIVAARSDHSTGQALDLGRRVDYAGPLNNLAPSIDDLTADHGLVRPVASDPVHYRLAVLGLFPRALPPRLRVRVNSPVDILVTDPEGRRIGFDPAAGTIVNELTGPEEDFYRGPGMEPQVLYVGNTVPGTYRVTGIGTGDGPFTVTIQEIAEHGEVLRERRVTGVASPGASLQILDYLLEDPQLDASPPLVDPPLPITIIATSPAGTTAADSPPLATFLASAAAVDEMFGDAEPLPPRIAGVEIGASTVFPLGATVVEFRFRDVNGNIGSATSTVTVVAQATEPPGSVVYVPLQSPPSVARVDTATGQILGTFQTTTYCGTNIPIVPTHVAIDPSGRRAFVLDPGCGGIDVVDLATLQKVRSSGILTIDTIGRPAAIAFDRFGRRAFVATSFGPGPDPGRLEVIDVRRLSIVRVLGLASPPTGVAVDPAATRAYVSVAGEVAIVDVASLTTAATVPLGPSVVTTGIALSHDGARAFVTASRAGGHSLEVIDTAAAAVVASIPLPAYPYSIRLHPAANRVYVQHASGIAVVSTTTLQVLGALGGAGTSLAFSPDGAILAGAASATSFRILRLADGASQSIALPGSYPGHAAVAPPCTYETAEGTYTIVSAGGTLRIPVTAPPGCSWTVHVEGPWLTPVTTSGIGSGVLELAAPANGGGARKALLSVSGEAVTVVQGGSLPAPYTFVSMAVELGWHQRQYGGALAAIDEAVGEVIAHLPLGPTAMAASPSGHRLYALEAGRVVEVDTAHLEILGSVALGAASEIAVTPDGALLLASSGDRLWGIETAGRQLDWVFRMNDGTAQNAVHSMQIVRGGQEAWFIRGGATIDIVSLPLRAVAAAMVPGEPLQSLRRRADGAEVYALVRHAGGEAAILVLDVASRAVARRLPLPISPRPEWAVSPDGRYAYVPYELPAGILRIDLTTGATVVWPAPGISRVWVGASSDRVYATRYGLHSILSFDSGNGAQVWGTALNEGSAPGLAGAATVPAADLTCRHNFRHYGSIDAEGGPRPLHVVPTTTGCGAWHAVSDVPWITIESGGSGVGYGIVSYRVAPNDGPLRIGTISVNGRPLAVRQPGPPQPLVLAAVTPSSGPPAGNTWVTVRGRGFGSPYAVWFGNAGAHAFSVLDADTLAVLTPPGAVNTTVDVSVWQASGIATLRNAFSYTADGLPPCVPVPSPPAFTVEAAGGILMLAIAAPAGCPWYAASADAWVGVSANGTGNGQVQVQIAPNTGAARVGTLFVSGRAVTISQGSVTDGSVPCVPSLGAVSADAPSTGATVTVAVAAPPNCAWTSVSPVSWVQVSSGAVGTGSGTVRLQVAANATSSSRTAILTIAHQAFTVTQAGHQVDLTFGAAGKVTLNFGGLKARARAVALQADGRIVVAGDSQATGLSSSADFAVARLNPDGTLDESFGDGGWSTVDFFGLEDRARAVAVQADGAIVLAGIAVGPASTTWRVALVRMLPNGRLDPGFGEGGRVVSSAGIDSSAVAVQADGRIVVAGQAWDGFSGTTNAMVARYNVDGSPDLSFTGGGGYPCMGGPGYQVVDITGFGPLGGDWHDHATSLLVLADGRILVGGSGLVIANQSNQYDSVLLRLEPDGACDRSFGAGGVAAIDMDDGLGGTDVFRALAMDASGRIVAAGGADVMSTQHLQYFSAFTLGRLDPDGVVDPLFGAGGVVRSIFQFDAPFLYGDGVTGLALDGQGRIVTAGTTVARGAAASDFRVVRYSAAGALDGAFSAAGYVTTDFFGGHDGAHALALQPDGRIVVAGYATAGDGSERFALARYLGAGECTYTASLWFDSYPAAGGFGYADVATQSGCPWTAVSNAPWMTVTSAASSAGSGLATFTVAPNTGMQPRTGTVTIAGRTLTVTQAGTCTYALSHTGLVIGAQARTEAVAVTALAGCSWVAVSQVSWITVTSGASGSGSGSVNLSIAANVSSASRVGTLIIAGRTFTVEQSGGLPLMELDRTRLHFGAVTTGSGLLSHTSAQIVRLTQQGAGSVAWTATSNVPWLSVSPASGQGSGALTVSLVPSAALPAGSVLSGAIVLSLTGAGAPVGPVTVVLRTHASGASGRPWGVVDGPADHSTGISGAVPFTGWALDDVEVTGVTLCRASVAPEVVGADARCGGAAQVFIGNAVFVEGARPDVQAAYELPHHSRAGWGYMVLTNMLPDIVNGRPSGGNGSYTFFMYARDREGQVTLLGTRTITCDNGHATRPFGTIDTPGQGDVIAGAGYLSFGWALTPNPKFIPTDGSTLNVFVDGMPVGTPTYNLFRSDIAALFPGLANSSGAVGYRVLDTTQLANGVHTIAWSATDSQGETEGLGSRYFTVSNSTGAASQVADAQAASWIAAAGTREGQAAALSWPRGPLGRDGWIGQVPLETSTLRGRQGWTLSAPWRDYPAGATGETDVHGEETGRIELQLPEGARSYAGYTRVGPDLGPLPIGSRLDPATGRFTWQPGVGFVGAYRLVFVRTLAGGAAARHEVRIVLRPKGSRAGSHVIIDAPREYQDVSQPFVLGGWAADLGAPTGTGIDTVHVWAYPVGGGAPQFLGVADGGGERPDLAALYGEQFRASGYGLTVQGLAAGAYDVAVFAWSRATGAFLPASVVRVTVR